MPPAAPKWPTQPAGEGGHCGQHKVSRSKPGNHHRRGPDDASIAHHPSLATHIVKRRDTTTAATSPAVQTHHLGSPPQLPRPTHTTATRTTCRRSTGLGTNNAWVGPMCQSTPTSSADQHQGRSTCHGPRHRRQLPAGTPHLVREGGPLGLAQHRRWGSPRRQAAGAAGYHGRIRFSHPVLSEPTTS